MTFSPNMNSGVTGSKTEASILLLNRECVPCVHGGMSGDFARFAQAAVLGKMTVYPTTTGANQIASEKDYPVDFSHFNINGRAFGAIRTLRLTNEHAEIFSVDLTSEYGSDNRIRPGSACCPARFGENELGRLFRRRRHGRSHLHGRRRRKKQGP